MRLKKLTSVDHLHVTCSMTKGSEDLGAQALGHAHRHQGYSKIAIHYVIRRGGKIETGRPTDEPGCLAPGANHRSIQVCLIGGVSDALEPEQNFTELQIESLHGLRESLQLPLTFGQESPLRHLKEHLCTCPSKHASCSTTCVVDHT